MEVQEKDLVVWVETQPPVMSVSSGLAFILQASLIPDCMCAYTHTYICTCLYIHVFMNACGYMYLLKAHKLIIKNDPSSSLKFFRFVLRI